MKKLNTTYLDNLVSKILKETLEERADTLVSKIKGDVCECGGQMYEGECEECGYKGEMDEDIHDVSDINGKFDYVQEDTDTDEFGVKITDKYNDDDCEQFIKNFGEDDPETQRRCQGKKTETDEGNAFTGALSQARKTGDKDFEVDGKKFETKEGKKFPDLTGDGKVTRKDVLVGRGVKLKENEEDTISKLVKDNDTDKIVGLFNNKTGFEPNAHGKKLGHKSHSTKIPNGTKFGGKEMKESYQLTENELISMIENIVKEQKDKSNIKVVGGSPRGLETYKQIHKKDGKENDDYIKSVTKKMKEYLKDGSKGDFDMNPKMFPKGNGEIEKMRKKAYSISDGGKEFIDDFMSPGMENLDYDQIEPNEEQITNNIEGSSKTGNDSSYANAVETDVNKKINVKRKANKFAKVRNMAYQKAPQPIKDATGDDSGKGVNIKLESTEDKKTKQINEEFDRMKSLIGYSRKTQ